MGVPDLIERWHRVAKHGELALLDELLAEDVVFHSPVVHTPQKGKALTRLYLSAAFGVFSSKGDGESVKPSADKKPSAEKKSSPFRYVREIYGERDAMLEFVTEIDGIVINGVDIISWNDANLITDFKVMVRPLKAINLLHAQMARMLEQLKPT